MCSTIDASGKWARLSWIFFTRPGRKCFTMMLGKKALCGLTWNFLTYWLNWEFLEVFLFPFFGGWGEGGMFTSIYVPWLCHLCATETDLFCTWKSFTWQMAALDWSFRHCHWCATETDLFCPWKKGLADGNNQSSWGQAWSWWFYLSVFTLIWKHYGWCLGCHFFSSCPLCSPSGIANAQAYITNTTSFKHAIDTMVLWSPQRIGSALHHWNIKGLPVENASLNWNFSLTDKGKGK